MFCYLDCDEGKEVIKRVGAKEDVARRRTGSCAGVGDAGPVIWKRA